MCLFKRNNSACESRRALWSANVSKEQSGFCVLWPEFFQDFALAIFATVLEESSQSIFNFMFYWDQYNILTSLRDFVCWMARRWRLNRCSVPFEGERDGLAQSRLIKRLSSGFTLDWGWFSLGQVDEIKFHRGLIK